MKYDTIPVTMTAAAYALLRLPEVKARTGLSRSEIYRRVGLGTFPAPLKIGTHASAWNSAEVDAWIAARIAERDTKAAGAR
jgi:prophage regulatory protein